MSNVTMTVRQIVDLGLWDKVCEYKGWDAWCRNEGQVDDDELVTFDTEFYNEETKEEDHYIKIHKLIGELYEQTAGIKATHETIFKLHEAIVELQCR